MYSDAINLAKLSISLTENESNGDVLARNSVLNSIFSLEAAANCFLDCCDQPKSLSKSFDKLAMVEKYELLLLYKNREKRLDRGSAIVQKVSELVSKRNSYVHPRPKSIEPQYEKNEITERDYQFSKNSLLSSSMGFPENPMEWNGENAVQAINAVSDFMSMFLIEMCELTPKDSMQFLCDELYEDGVFKVMFGKEWSGHIIYARREWGVKSSFVYEPYLSASLT
ncbi:hypothetical protein BCF53_1492 [Reinekea marinisedimentorum]|uniref:Uncharacterized protein n=1 Tax=Reinekea marinisedimentorum TaxID=230495 RepID=A0A4V2UI70_9GAMM|nr:hypothetical protein BCF53_1492 [Reinekea marinisedimentorum]